MTLKSTDTMERITRQQLADNFDEILEKVNNEDIGYVILDNEGNAGQVLCPAKWLESSTEAEDIPTAMHKLKRLKESAYELVENTIKKVEDGSISDKDALEDFQFMLMDYGDDVRFFELYRSLTKVMNEKFPSREKGK